MILFSHLSPEIRNILFSRARGKRVVFPEARDERIQVASELLRSQVAVTCETLTNDVCKAHEIETLSVLRQRTLLRGKQIPETQLLTLASNPFYVAGAMLENGYADAAVGGATVPTADVIRAALATVGVDSRSPLVTSCFLFQLRDKTPGGEDLLLFSDAGVIPQPDSVQLSHIAALAVDAFSHWTGREPRVGFLSFSTHGSAQHPDVEKVRRAAQMFDSSYPLILSEGELQFDAAIVPEVALRKSPASRLAGRANVLVFPDLDAANIAYKVTQRLAGAEAWGPLLLGTAKPYSDLSRGASALDIAHVAVLALALAG